MGEVKQETGKSGDQSDIALSVPFHKVLTFRTIVMFPKHYFNLISNKKLIYIVKANPSGNISNNEYTQLQYKSTT